MKTNDLIFGYTWNQIQEAQQGKEFRQYVSGNVTAPKCTQDDLDLLEKHGIDGLEKMQLFGVIDRLKRSGKVTG